MELRQLRQFVAVADHLSFRRAAQTLHIAQPPLSVAIKKLEREWGVVLFHRLGRRIELTDAGRAALPAARRGLMTVELIAGLARDAESGESGHLRIGFVGSATYSLLPKLLLAFRRRYPRVDIELREAINVEILPDLEAESLDIGIVRVPTYQPAALDFLLSERDVFKAALPVDHRLAKRQRLSLIELAGEPLVGYGLAKVPGMQALVTSAFQHVGRVPVVAQEAFQVQTILSLVRGGIGVALVPGVCEHNTPAGVVLRRIADLPKSANLGLAIASRRDSTNAAIARWRELAALRSKDPDDLVQRT